MNTFNYQDAQLELNKRIDGGEVPEGAIAVEGYGFGFKGGHKNLTYTERRGPQDDLQDIIGVGGRWFFVHVLEPSFSYAAHHYGGKNYANRGELMTGQLERYGLE